MDKEQWIRETGNQMGDMPKLLVFLMMSVMPAVGLICFGLIVYLMYLSVLSRTFMQLLVIRIFCLSAFIFLIYLGWILIDAGLAKYHFEEEGLRVKYPLRRSKLIPWAQFQQVCVIYAAYTTFGPRRANTGICAVRMGEQLNIYRRWKTNPFRYKTVIQIHYTEERYMELKKICPLEVVDLRNTPAYRL